MIKVGVVGYGYSAQTFHLPLIESLESFELTAISSSQTETVREKYPTVSIFDTVHDLIVNSGVELVVITAPNDVHFPLAKLCLEHGIHVVLEKPMVTTSCEAEELTNFAKRQSLILSVFHNRRWDVDQAICLFGLPDSLTARCLTLRKNSNTTDYFHVLLHYKALEVVLHASSFSAGPNRRFQMEGTNGSFVKYGFDPQEEQLKKGIVPSEAIFGLENSNQFGTLYMESNNTQIETDNTVNTSISAVKHSVRGLVRYLANRQPCAPVSPL